MRLEAKGHYYLVWKALKKNTNSSTKIVTLVNAYIKKPNSDLIFLGFISFKFCLVE